MKLKERIRALAVHLDRLMHEGEPSVIRLMTPERSMAREKQPPQEEAGCDLASPALGEC